MGIITADELYQQYMSDPKVKAENDEYARLRKDIDLAKKAIKDALDSYRKKKTRARSKKAATENPFAELDEWASLNDIQEAYGYDQLTEAQYRRPCDLWEAREASKLHKQGEAVEYHDRVTDLLETAIRRVGDEYTDKIEDYEDKLLHIRIAAQNEARRQNDRQWEKEHGGDPQ